MAAFFIFEYFFCCCMRMRKMQRQKQTHICYDTFLLCLFGLFSLSFSSLLSLIAVQTLYCVQTHPDNCSLCLSLNQWLSYFFCWDLGVISNQHLLSWEASSFTVVQLAGCSKGCHEFTMLLGVDTHTHPDQARAVRDLHSHSVHEKLPETAMQ